MESSTPAAVTAAVGKHAEAAAEQVPMGRLLAATAAAAAVCTPPSPREPKPGDQGTTCTRVPSGAKSQRV
ncbi:hypothetical protein ACFZB9_12275 [Kitasatospora sp. NPDC008050]|uniref:hypothetical protein n=1 Tax=Kitasatospora sp. NPDC008050 TaxID=3364021 RepID=UPI0036E42DDB